MSLPRIITVDPEGNLSRIIHAAVSLLDRPVIQVDCPSSSQALQEIKAGCTLILTTFEIDDAMKGFELAARVKRELPDAAVIVLGEEDDPEEFDDETAAESPFIYLRQPLDVQRFMTLLTAGLEGRDLNTIRAASPMQAAAVVDYGPVPGIDTRAAQAILDPLLIDLGAMALILATRTGELLLECGAVGYLNREELTQVLLPAVHSGINIRGLVGGNMYAVQFFDGEEYDVFLLSVGLHHFLCAVFDGQVGQRQFGGVNRFGRRAVEDLLGLIGANAFFIQPPARTEEEVTRRSKKKATRTEEDEVPLVRAELEISTPAPEPAVMLEPIEADLDDLSELFSDAAAVAGDADDLFNIDEIEELVNNAQKNARGKLDWDQAAEIGIIK
jgi:hypothetical protein